MGRLHLPLEELTKQFPTVDGLANWGEGKDGDEWGLCLDEKNKIFFGRTNKRLQLQVSLNKIYELVRFEYGEEYDALDILVSYGVDYVKGCIVTDFIEISSYKENIIAYLPGVWMLFQK